MPDTMTTSVRPESAVSTSGMASGISMVSVLVLAAAVSCFCSRKPAEAAPPSGAARVDAPASMPSPCSLVTAEEVGAILGRRLVSSGSGATCEYQNAAQPTALPESRTASMDSLMASLASTTPAMPQMPQAVAALTDVKLDLARDGMTEAQVKGIHARVGKTVRRALDPEQKGLHDTIVVANDIPKVGDWAFTTNVAAVNMGFGLSSRGRILQTRKGPWHLTVGATISPDPGEAALDAELADVARVAIARLP